MRSTMQRCIKVLTVKLCSIRIEEKLALLRYYAVTGWSTDLLTLPGAGIEISIDNLVVPVLQSAQIGG